MPFCVEYFEKNKWKVMKNTINVAKEDAEKAKLSLIACGVDVEDKHIPVKERYRIKRLRTKEAKAILGDKYEA